jgi:glucose-6-phosphate dehydrogenase assembly protein OpcA
VEEAIAASAILPDRLLRELAELWVNLGEQQGGTSQGVLRACTRTLFVFLDQEDDAVAAGETLAMLMRDHPSRAVAVRVDPAPERMPGARVFAQCWMPFGQRQEICCEQVEITIPEAMLGELPPVLLPLAVANLPVTVWCRSPRVFFMPAFSGFALLAGQVIVDSSGFDDPAAVLKRLAAGRAESVRFADLAWTRLTPWRELIAQIFENRRYLGCLARTSRAAVFYSGARIPVEAFYLGAWLLRGLERVGSQAQIQFLRQDEQVPGAIFRVELSAPEAVSSRFGIAVNDRVAETHIDGLVNRTDFAVPTEYSVLREELSIHERDRVFEEVLGRAAELAGFDKRSF